MQFDPFEIIDEIYAQEPELKKLLLKHVCQVRDKALFLAELSGLPVKQELLVSGSLLHDIGVLRCHAPGILCRGTEPYITHGLIGAEILRKYGREKGLDLEACARICERHTGSGLTVRDITLQNLPLPQKDFLPETTEEKLICLADKFFSKSGTMEEKTFSAVRRSMEKFGMESLDRFDALCRFAGLRKQL